MAVTLGTADSPSTSGTLRVADRSTPVVAGARLRLVEPVALGSVEPFAPGSVEPDAARQLRLSAVVPATDSPPTLDRCLAAIRAAADPPGEIVVVRSPAGARPAVARNRGAQLATGDVLVFIDADVEVQPDAFQRIRTILSEEGGVTAMFGSYDDDPACHGTVSQFRNLLHHHVHQGSPGTIGSFWAGLGAIRREAFDAAGGFTEHPVEDVELGMRLAADGASIVLDPRVQGKHLKEWTIASMVKTDLLVRGGPWIGLALRHRAPGAILNLGWRHRLSAASSLWISTAIARRRPCAALGALALLVSLNRRFYLLLLRRRGPAGATAGIALHVLHHLTSVAAVPTGIARYALERKKERA